jgi:hypothetical protein
LHGLDLAKHGLVDAGNAPNVLAASFSSRSTANGGKRFGSRPGINVKRRRFPDADPAESAAGRRLDNYTAVRLRRWLSINPKQIFGKLQQVERPSAAHICDSTISLIAESSRLARISHTGDGWHKLQADFAGCGAGATEVGGAQGRGLLFIFSGSSWACW